MSTVNSKVIYGELCCCEKMTILDEIFCDILIIFPQRSWVVVRTAMFDFKCFFGLPFKVC